MKPYMFELIAVNILQRFEKLDSRLRCQVLEQKDWKLSWEIKSNEYISVFPLTFQFPLNVLCSYKALINSTCNSGLYRIYKHSYFLFFQLITYHWSFVSYQNICIFIKWKHVKYHAERSKYPFPRGKNFPFSARGERRVYLKKNSPWAEISPRGEFHLAYV